MNEFVRVERMDDGRIKCSFTFSDALFPVHIYMHTHPKKILQEKGSRLASLTQPGHVIIDDPSPEQRLYFRFQTSDQKVFVSAERRLNLEGPKNFRDLGGYQTRDGRITRWGCLYRSDQPETLSARDQKYLKRLGLKIIVDLRKSLEAENSPSSPVDGITFFHRSVFPDQPFDPYSKLMEDENYPWKTLKETYLEIIHDENAQQVYRELLDLSASAREQPMMFHCASGKDRTGLGAAFLLYALDVPESTILLDYMLSRLYLKEKNRQLIHQLKTKWKNPVLFPLIEDTFSLQEDYLLAAFQSIRHHYGSVDHYLEKKMGLTPEKKARLQQKLLYPQ